MSTTRIPNVSNKEFIKAFFGSNVKYYQYTVTDDDFDEYDNDAPGEYYGFKVPAKLGPLWDEGIQECKSLGIHPLSGEGLLIRLRKFHPEATELPEAVAEVAQEYEEKELKKETEAKNKSDHAEFIKYLTLNCYKISLSHGRVGVNQRLEGELFERGVTHACFPDTALLEKIIDRQGYGGTFYRLPSGDLLLSWPGFSVVLYTRDIEFYKRYCQLNIEDYSIPYENEDEKTNQRRLADVCRWEEELASVPYKGVWWYHECGNIIKEE